MVASARLAYQARRAAEYGVRTGPVSVDLAAVRERKRAMVAGARENYASRLPQDGLDLIEGEARFTGPKTLEIALMQRRDAADQRAGGRHRRRHQAKDAGDQRRGGRPSARLNVDHGA